MIRFTTMPSPLGPLRIAADAGGLTEIEFTDRVDAATAGMRRDDGDALLCDARRQLEQYFDGERRIFELPLAPRGTPFQQRVWQALRELPYGQTCSYADIACRLQAPTATRAVGAANGRNPLAIVVPCHRVIGRDGTLTGYAGGIERKRRLLELEGCAAVRDLFD